MAQVCQLIWIYTGRTCVKTRINGVKGLLFYYVAFIHNYKFDYFTFPQGTDDYVLGH
jgi:hypothetical protein